jgi:coenzyme F420-reducing hydrogenase beta subunit
MESDEDGCSCFKGSKYVQSNMGNCFVECKNELNKGRLVLFTGTGCQIHGLLRYLDVANVSTDRLYTMDLVCHGTPSPGVWKQYIMEYEKRSGTKVIDVNFRDKNVKGWGAHIEKYKFSDGNEINNEKWATVFYRHVMFRESCYNCKYTTTNRKSDITVADFWGVGKVLPELDDNRGVSLVLVHSEKGKEIFNALCKKVIVKEVPLKKCMQPQLMHPAEKKYDYNFFWMLYKKNHQKAVCFYFFPSFPASILFSIETMLKKLKKVLKKLITRK